MRPWLTVMAISIAISACTKDNTNTIVNTPNGDFVGYSDPSQKQTVCGNCHIDRQRAWQATHHANAWTDLQASGHASPACDRCHTTNGRSNQAPDSAGYFSASADAKKFYYDVQCESCHGPGATHISAPDATQPLTTIVADTNLAVGCGACHNGVHTPFIEQWKESGHGFVEPATNNQADCKPCHSAQGALARFAPRAHYLEQNSATWQPLTCAVCHDPHGSENSAQLRYPISEPDVSTNLCMQCHYRRSVPDPTSSRGAHSPQGPMLLGEAGWIPPNFQYDGARQASSHGQSGNPRLCAGCHVEMYDVTDKLTGAFVIHSTGHTFRAIPCVDANGAPIDTLTSCPDTQRRFNACATSGCHATPATAMNLRQVLTGRLTNEVRTIWIDVNHNGVLDPFPTDSGLVARVKATTPGDFSTTGAGAQTITVGEGAWFNADLVQRADGSFGVHNPIFAEALLLGSISALHSQYPYLP